MGHCKDCIYQENDICHRMPPQMVAWPIDNQRPEQTFPYPTWPSVLPTDWCGEWKDIAS